MSWANLVLDLASIPSYRASDKKEGNKPAVTGKVAEVSDDNLDLIDQILGIK